MEGEQQSLGESVWLELGVGSQQTGLAELTVASHSLQEGVFWHAGKRLQRLIGVLLRHGSLRVF